MAEERKAAGKDPNPRQPISLSERVVLGEKEQSTSARNANGAKIVPQKPKPAHRPASTRVPIFGSAAEKPAAIPNVDKNTKFIKGLPDQAARDAARQKKWATLSPEDRREAEALAAIEDEYIIAELERQNKQKGVKATPGVAPVAAVSPGAGAAVKRRPAEAPALAAAPVVLKSAAVQADVLKSDAVKTAKDRFANLPPRFKDALAGKKRPAAAAAAAAAAGGEEQKPVSPLNAAADTLERSPAGPVPVTEAAPAAAEAHPASAEAPAATAPAGKKQEEYSSLNVADTLERRPPGPPGPAPAAAGGVEPLNQKHTNLERPPLQTSSPLMTGKSMSNPIISPRKPGNSALQSPLQISSSLTSPRLLSPRKPGGLGGVGGGSKKRTSSVKHKKTVKKNKKNAHRPKKGTKKIVKYPKKRKFTIKIR
jgi:hypothetical protein